MTSTLLQLSLPLFILHRLEQPHFSSSINYTMSGLSSGLKNWHWRSKNTQPWAVQWFKKNLGQLSTPKTRVVEVRDVDGDCDLGMRKSKVP